MNPRFPPVLIATKTTIAEVDQSEVIEELERSAPIRDFVGTS